MNSRDANPVPHRPGGRQGADGGSFCHGTGWEEGAHARHTHATHRFYAASASCVGAHGSSVRPHASSAGAHGSSVRPHGSSVTPHASLVRPHGSSVGPRASSVGPHGSSVRPHGRSGAAHGSSVACHLSAPAGFPAERSRGHKGAAAVFVRRRRPGGHTTYANCHLRLRHPLGRGQKFAPGKFELPARFFRSRLGP